jgi:hypothetical protein
MRAAAQAATLASAPVPDPLHMPVPNTDVQRAGFTPDDLKRHPFFRETLAAAEAGDPDWLAPVEDAVENDSDSETVLASLAVAFGGLYERAAELDAYLQHEVCFFTELPGSDDCHRLANSFEKILTQLDSLGIYRTYGLATHVVLSFRSVTYIIQSRLQHEAINGLLSIESLGPACNQ